MSVEETDDLSTVRTLLVSRWETVRTTVQL